MREQCTVVGCNGLVKARELCNKHYLVQYRQGRLETPNRTERVLEFVKHCLIANTDECIEPPFKLGEEYPSFVWEGTYYKVGWLVLERAVGPKPQPNDVMRHVVCANSRCCNPRHLCWGTEKENAEDRKRHGHEPDRTGMKNSNYRHGRYVKNGTSH